jgi:hypothetical protein
MIIWGKAINIEAGAVKTWCKTAEIRYETKAGHTEDKQRIFCMLNRIC